MKYLNRALFLTLCFGAGNAGGQEVWLGRVPTFRVVCAQQAIDSENPDPAAWSDLQKSFQEGAATDLGARLALPVEATEPQIAAPVPKDLAPSTQEPVPAKPTTKVLRWYPCAQIYDEARIAANAVVKDVTGGPALFAYCPGASPAPCYGRLRELLEVEKREQVPLMWSRTILGWADEQGRGYSQPEAKDLEAAATLRELLREPPDGNAILIPLGFLVVTHLGENEVTGISAALAPASNGKSQ